MLQKVNSHYINRLILQLLIVKICKAMRLYIIKTTMIIRRVDDLGSGIIPKDIGIVLRIHEGGHLCISVCRR